MSADTVRALVSYVAETDHRFLLYGDRANPDTTLWSPYQPADFIGIVWECMPELKGTLFLDVGCGPGTKVKIAAGLFGLHADGIEIDPVMASEAARELCMTEADIEQADALDYDCYGIYDLIWLDRPLRNPVPETRLEKQIISDMKPGAILAGSSWETDPGALGWQPVVDDCLMSPDGASRIFRGAWQKPGTNQT